MYINPISFNGIFSSKNNKKAQNRNNAAEPVQRPYLKVPPQTEPPKAPKAHEFVRDGGKFYFDTAQKDYKPYNGSVEYDYHTFHMSTRYDDGKKDSMFMFLNDTDKTAVLAWFEKFDEVDNADGGQTIYYKTISHEGEYIEDYDYRGRLQYATVLRYMDDKTQPDNRGKFISETSIEFDPTGTKVKSTKSKIAESLQREVGFATKKTMYDEDGKRISEEKTNVIGDKIRVGKRYAEYDEKGFKTRKIDYDCKFYLSKESKEPYASCDTKEIIKRGGRNYTVYEGFNTLDYTDPFNSLRNYIYEEKQNSTKVDSADRVVYADGETKEPYVVEYYGDQNELVAVENLITGEKTDISILKQDLLLATKYNKRGKRIEETRFLIGENSLKFKEHTIYDPITGKQKQSRRMTGDEEEKIVTNPDGSGTLYRYKNGFLYMEVTMGGDDSHKVIYEESGRKAVIKIGERVSTKAVYNAQGMIEYIDEFEDNLATKRTMYKDGKPDKEIPCFRGYPYGDYNETRITFNTKVI